MRTTLRKTEVITPPLKPFQYEPKWAFRSVLDVMQSELPSLENLPEGTKAIIVRLDDNALKGSEVKSLGLFSDILGVGAVILYNVKKFHRSELGGTNLAQRLFYADTRREAMSQARIIAGKMSGS